MVTFEQLDVLQSTKSLPAYHIKKGGVWPSETRKHRHVHIHASGHGPNLHYTTVNTMIEGSHLLALPVSRVHKVLLPVCMSKRVTHVVKCPR